MCALVKAFHADFLETGSGVPDSGKNRAETLHLPTLASSVNKTISIQFNIIQVYFKLCLIIKKYI